MRTESEHLDVYLEEALETVDCEEVRKKWDNEMTRMDKMRYNEKIRVEIDEHSRKSCIELLQDTEWCRTNLPKSRNNTQSRKKISCIFEGAMALTTNKYVCTSIVLKQSL